MYLLATSIVCLGSNAPEFGRTQYFLGAVVFILKRIFLSVGLVNRIYDITDTLNGPKTIEKKNHHYSFDHIVFFFFNK